MKKKPAYPTVDKILAASADGRNRSKEECAQAMAEYLADDKEKDDYKTWCQDNDRDPKDLSGNSDHIYACAMIVGGWEYGE